MIKFTCSSCAQIYRVPDEYGGKRVKCKSCNNINTIPSREVVTLDSGDSIAAYNSLLQELSKVEKQAPAVELDSWFGPTFTLFFRINCIILNFSVEIESIRL